MWSGDDELTVDGVCFHAAVFGRAPSTPGRFTLLKNREMIEGYAELLAELRPRHVVELGIFAGGSTALIELLASPAKLVAFELASTRVDALDDLVRTRGAADRVRVHYGVDQGDLALVSSVLVDEFGPDPTFDLVLDDASHDLDLTRGTFELLFPLLRPGGVFVIEDWAWGHVPFARTREGPSLAKLVMEVVLSVPFAPGLVDRVVVDKYWALVYRGDRAPGPGPFELGNHLSPRGRQLMQVHDEDPRLGGA